jgi:DNA polymerase-3 subunit epsilon
LILAFDTETTGLPDWGAPSDAKHQPHLVQLAMILLDDDLTERASVSLIVRPDGWVIPDDVAKIHGITTEMAERLGVPEKVATALYAQLLYGTGATVVAHNVKFDLRIMRIAMLRAGWAKDKLDARKPDSFCTLNAATPLVNLPPTPKMVAAGFKKPKPPKLSECIEFFFQETLVGAHDALVDVRACLRVYRHIVQLSAAPDDEVIV